MGILSRIGNRAAEMANVFVGISNGNQGAAGCCGQGGCQGQVQEVYAPPALPQPLPQAYSSPLSVYMSSNQKKVYQLGNMEFYHGTNEDAALKVFYEMCWVFGNLAKPLAIWMTTNLATAQGYSGNSGRILVLYVKPNVQLKHEGSGIYTFVVPLAKPNTKYDISDFVEPVALLDYNGNQLA